MKDTKFLTEIKKLLIVGQIQFKLYEGELLTEEELKILVSTPDDEILLGLQVVSSNRLEQEDISKTTNFMSNINRLKFLKKTKKYSKNK